MPPRAHSKLELGDGSKMGLEIVELLMRIEEEFEISIEDEEASYLTNVGDLHQCILTKLGLAVARVARCFIACAAR